MDDEDEADFARRPGRVPAGGHRDVFESVWEMINVLLPGGHIDASNANGAIHGFEAVRR